MLCRKCSKDMPEGASYCPWCGTKQEQSRRKSKRGNGTGSVYRRGNSWEARIVLRYEDITDSKPPKKRPIWKTKGGFRTKKDALDFIPVLRMAVDRPKGKAPQLIEYWNTYSQGELQNLSPSRQSAAKIAWNKLKDALQYRPVDQITVAELREAVSAVATTYYTVRDCKSVLTRLFELAGADGWCSKELPTYVVLPKLEERKREVFTVKEQKALWKLYEGGDIRAAVPLLMICTGMMPGEVQSLRVENIKLEEQKIVGVGMKTKVRRESPVYIPEDALPIVEDLIAHAQPSGILFVRNEDKWYADYYAALEAAGCRRLEPYCCRHTTATRLAIDKGIAPQTIQRMMRWSSTKMLDRYAHPDDQAVLKAANAIAKERAGKKKKASKKPDKKAPGQ